MFDFLKKKEKPAPEWFEQTYRFIDDVLDPKPKEPVERDPNVRYSIQVDDIELDDDEFFRVYNKSDLIRYFGTLKE